MKILVSYASAVASVVLVSGLFHSAPALADVCSEPSFAAALGFGAGKSPFAVAVADFNRDGKPDLAVADGGVSQSNPGGGAWVLLGKGDGTFLTAVKYAVGLLGVGDGSFQAAVNYGAGGSPRSVALGDFNGDAKPDIALANSASGYVSVLLGNGNGIFATAVNYATGFKPRYVAVGDFNSDGKTDLVVANNGPLEVSVPLNQIERYFRLRKP